jgi:hypothetical protein
MSFATWYDSAWQHPGLAWLGTLPIVWWAATRRSAESPPPDPAASPRRAPLSRRQRTLLWLLQALICLDALCTGALSPITGPSPLATASAVFFVIAGDARFFFLLQDPGLSRAGAVSRWLRALVVSTGFSAAAYVTQQLLPTQLPTSRHLFLTYELMLLTTTLALAAWRRPPGPVSACQRRLLAFEALQYGLWVLADLVILSTQSWRDLGFALRMLPNALYYVAFVPFAIRFGTLDTVESRGEQAQPARAVA